MSTSGPLDHNDPPQPPRKANASLVQIERQLREGLQSGYPGMSESDGGPAIRMEHLLADPTQADRIAKELS